MEETPRSFHRRERNTKQLSLLPTLGFTDNSDSDSSSSEDFPKLVFRHSSLRKTNSLKISKKKYQILN